ncbi:MAG: peptidoglycan DD-metalloendopeptidase family protein [Actinomycetota bacterium]
MIALAMPAPPDQSRSTFMPIVITTLVLTLGTVAATAPSWAGAGPGSSREKLESADWVPLTGRIRVGRTWGHRGGHAFPSIDFVVPAGKSVPVYAAGSGTVLAAEGGCRDTTPDGRDADCNGGHGNLVEIVHPDGRLSRYLHLHQGSLTVKPGEHVCRGCQIGRTGWSGNVSPPGPEGGHLHYEEIEGFRPVNPGPMLARRHGGRVTYPGHRRDWQDIGREGLVIRNLGYPRPGQAPQGSCFGYAATLVGTPKAEEIRGTAGPDIVLGGDGNDTIYGLSGDDRLCGGPGDDLLDGDSEYNYLDGGEGTDTCLSDYGNETAAEGTVVSCELPPFTLLVNVRCCLRFVTSEPAGISCPPDCDEPYANHTQVTLTLSSGATYWQGCDTVTGSTCTLTMDQDRTVSV